MNKLAITLGIATLASVALADGQILYDNGSIINGPNNTSVITAPNSLFGYGAQVAANNRVADDFVAGAGWSINGFCFAAYQTSSTAYTMTTANVSLLRGADINTATVENTWTDLATTNEGFIGYRVSSATPTATNRGVYNVGVKFGNKNLVAGATYWVVWSLAGSLASGPWIPQVMDGVNPKPGNGQQSINGAAFAAVTWGTGGTSELPFCVQGVPEPGTMAALAAGIAAIAARRRRK